MILLLHWLFTILVAIAVILWIISQPSPPANSRAREWSYSFALAALVVVAVLLFAPSLGLT